MKSYRKTAEVSLNETKEMKNLIETIVETIALSKCEKYMSQSEKCNNSLRNDINDLKLKIVEVESNEIYNVDISYIYYNFIIFLSRFYRK